MEGRYTEKLEEKLATSIEVIEGQKTLDGRDRQIEEANDAADAAQVTATQALGVATRAHLFEFPVAGAGAIGTGNASLSFAYEVARKAHIRSSNPALGNPVLNYACDVAENATNLANKALILDTTHAEPKLNVGNFAIYQAWSYAEQAYKFAGIANSNAGQAQNRADAAFNVGNHNHPYANTNHSHNEYASKTHKHPPPNIPARTGPGSASAGHTHTI